jgi:FixJ family two-component response regulator
MSKPAGWIAIVDDDLSVLRALKRLLRLRAFEAKGYGSAQDLLAALPQGLPDCMILDLHMPDMNGFELLQHLKRKGVRIPTIIMTAHDDAGVRGRCEAAGAVAYFAKPFKNSSLLAAVQEATKGGRNGSS